MVVGSLFPQVKEGLGIAHDGGREDEGEEDCKGKLAVRTDGLESAWWALIRGGSVGTAKTLFKLLES